MHNFYISLQSTCHVIPTTTSTTVPSTLPTTTETPSTIFKTCLTNAECSVTDSECRDGTCQCTLGLSHDPATDTCTPCKYIGAGPEVIKLFSCSTQLSTKFILLINVKMPTIVGILTFISKINTTSERLKTRKLLHLSVF